MIALALLVASVLQDADRLVGQLADDRIEVRERAARDLLEMGAAARPALEKAAKGQDAEVTARAKQILEGIALVENRGKVFGKVGRVTLAEGEYPLGKIAGVLKEQTEIALAVPEELAGDRVRIGAREELLWPFVDRLCVRHGGLRLADRQPAEALRLEMGTPAAPPVFYSGPFRVWIERLRLERRSPLGGEWNRGAFVLALSWPPNLRPTDDAHWTILEIVGDDGKALEMKQEFPSLYPRGNIEEGGRRLEREFFPFTYPARGVRMLSRVRGRVDLAFPQKRETVIFEKPLESSPSSKKAGAYSISIRGFRSGEGGITGTVEIRSPEEREGAPGRAQRVQLYSRFDPQSVTLVDGEGNEHRGEKHWPAMHSGKSADGVTTEGYSVEVCYPKAASAASLRFEFLTEYFEKVIEFEFKDVELP